MTLKREQMAAISRLLDEALVLDEAGRRQWLEDLPSQHQGLAESLRAALFPDASRPDLLSKLPKIIAGPEPQIHPSGLEGVRIGHYRVLSLLGHGGMGSVWLAERADGLFTRQVALKLIHPALKSAATAARATTAKKLSSTLRGDLDTIAIKAMKKAPTERYATVNAFGEDIERFLRGDVVLAQPDSAAYRALKFARRHWVGIAVASALILTLTGGLAATAYQAQRAEREGKKATAVKDFLIDIFKQSSVQNPGGVGAKKITAEQLLDVGAQRIRTQLRAQPEVREELMDTLASLNNDLGLIDRAQTLAADNLAEINARTGGRPSVELARLEIALASAMINRDQKELTVQAQEHLHKALADLHAVAEGDSVEAATAYYQLGRAADDSTIEGKAEGKRALRRALDILARRDPANPLRGDVFDDLAGYAMFEHDAADAEHWLTELLAFQSAQGEELNGYAIGDAYFKLADFQTQSMRYDFAERNYHHAIALLTKAAGADHPETADARARLAEMYYASDRPQQAEPLLRDALQRDMRTPQGVSNATEHRRTLAYVEFARGHWPEAEQLLRQDLAELKGDFENELRWGITANGLVAVLIEEGELSEARELHDKSKDVYRRYIGEKSMDYGWCVVYGGLLALAEHKPNEAVAIFEQVLREWPSAEGALTREYTRSTLGLAAAYLDLERLEQARRYADELLKTVRAAPAPNQSRDVEAKTLRLLGEALRRLGRAGEAEKPLRQAVELRESLDDDAVSPWLAQARIDLAECLIVLHQKAEAKTLIRKAAAALSRQPRLSAIYRKELQQARTMIAKTA